LHKTENFETEDRRLESGDPAPGDAAGGKTH